MTPSFKWLAIRILLRFIGRLDFREALLMRRAESKAMSWRSETRWFYCKRRLLLMLLESRFDMISGSLLLSFLAIAI